MKGRQRTKKILAGFMALSMILSCGVTNFTEVSAEEADAPPLYEVHLNESENGSLHFEGVEEKTLSVQEGETVQIASHPLEGYETETIEVVGEDTGTKIEVSTNENLYQFQMPAENVQVTGVYQAVETAQEGDSVEGEETTVESAPANNSEEEPKEEADGLKANSMVVAPALAAAPRAVGGTRTVTVSDGRYTQDLLRVGYFELDGGTKALCACHELQPPEAGTVMRNIATYTYANKANELLRKVMYYGWGGPADVGGSSDGDHYRETALAVSVANGHDDNFYEYGQAFIDRIRSKPNAPDGFTVYKIGTGTGIQDLAYFSWNPKGTLELEKESSNPSITDGNGCYSLEGAVYGVYSDEACTKSVGTLTTKADGTTNKLTLNAGTYYIKETKAPKGFALDKEKHKVTISAGKPTTFKAKDAPLNDPFTLTLEKIDDGKATNGAQGNASLAGAQFTVKYYDGFYERENLPKEATREWVFQTKERVNPSTGESAYYLRYGDEWKVAGDEIYTYSSSGFNLPTLPLGTITIQETKAPEGYTLDNGTMTSQKGETVTDGVYLAQIKQNGDVGRLDVGNEFTQNESVIRGGVKVQKRDNATGKTVPQEGLSFEGVELKIYNRSDNSVVVEGKEYAPGEAVKTLTLDKNGYAETASDLLPYGSYEIVETVPPTGYMNTGVVSRTFDITEDGQLVDLTKADTSIRNDLLRGDFEITKINSNTQEPMAGVQFKVTHVGSGESHIITTDENGFYSSSSEFNKHTQDTNGGKATSGLWFGEKPVLDDVGAMPYGVYTIEEIEGEANKGMVMYKSTFTITRYGFTVDLGNIENRPITLTTTAKDQDTNNHYSPARNEVTVIDEIFYTGVEPDHEYTVVGTLMNKATGLPVTDANGNEVTARRTFTPVAQTGIIEMELIFNSSKMAGMDLVVFEELYDAEGTLVGQHTDLTDEDQTIYVPKIETTAIDTATGEHVGKGQKTTTILDTVSFDNVHPGYEYTLEGVIYDRATGEPLLDKDGNEITVQTVFTPKTDHGSAIVQFTVDTSDLAGKTIVVYQQLTRRGETYAWHEDITSESQAIHFPLIGTKALDSESGIQNSLADESITIRDTVKYQNVVPGLSYTMKGTLYDKATGQPLTVNGKVVTAETRFVPNSADGETVVSFTFNGKDLAGKTLVCFEKLLYNNVELTNHEKIDSKEQTIYVPEIGTESKDAENGTQTSAADEDVTVTDKVSYKNLIPGTTYTVKGQLYNQETGQPMLDDAGKEITASKEFTPEKASGTVELTFHFSGVKLAGSTGVAFEEVYYKDHLVGIHASLDDESQMSFYPSLKTSASGSAKNLIYANKKASIMDTVTFDGVHPGKTYVLEATLRDQKTGDILKDTAGKAITGKTTFTPKATSGKAIVVLEFDASQMAGTSAVIFEQLKLDGHLVGSHEDKADKDQYIFIPKISTKAIDFETGIQNSLADKEIVINDTIRYESLTPGVTFVAKGVLMDKETGKPLLVDGKEVTSQTDFTPDKEDGEVTVSFKFNGEGLEGKTLVVAEEVYCDGTLVADHKDLSSKEQTIYIPKIGTTSSDTENGTQTSMADSEIKVKDVVAYENLIPGTTYSVKGKLYDQETGEPMLDDAGKEITASKEFTPEKASGSVELTFQFSGVKLAGKAGVIFEEVYYKDHLVGVHASLEDKKQMSFYPSLKTTAAGEERNLVYADGKATILDTVTFDGVQPGEEYVLEATLRDQVTGEILKDAADKEIKGKTTFTPQKISGKAIVTLEFDASDMAGTSAVVFEQLKVDGHLVGSHEDKADRDQYIYIPKIGTKAIDLETGIQNSLADDEITIVDTIRYESLTPCVTFVAKGVLMDKETGKPLLVNGKEVTSKMNFTPETEDGEVEVSFTFDGSNLEGKTVVVFEEVLCDGTLVADHKDLSSIGQTIYIPEIGTTATDGENGSQTSMADEEITVKDIVKYENLIPGTAYTVKGKLYDQETGKPMLDDNGNEITAEKEIIPTAANGEVEIVFTFSGVKLAGSVGVAFEEVYYKDRLVGVHASLEDESQMSFYPEIKTTAAGDLENLIYADGDAKVIDTVSYKGVQPGEEYVLEATLRDQKTGEVLKDKDGNAITGSTTFTPEDTSGTVDVALTFDASSLAGTSAVVFEQLKVDGAVVGRHEEVADTTQHIFIPSISTSAVDSDTGIRNSYADDSITVHDTVTYKGMAPGKEYVIKGKLMDKETGEPFLVNGKEVTSSQTFTPETPDGTVTVTFTFDGTGLENRAFVIYEQAFYKDFLVAQHCDQSDRMQTVTIPKIETTATDVENGTHTSNADEEVTVKDVVRYEKLIPGTTYTMEGILYDKETNEPLLDKDGNEVTSSVTFTPTAAAGSVEILFTFDGSLLAGKTLVAFETCSYEGKTVAVHADITDRDQTDYLPDLHTKARDTLTGTQFLFAGKDASITDEVFYKGLEPGEEYTLVTTLYDRETGEPLFVPDSNTEEAATEGEGAENEVQEDTDQGEAADNNAAGDDTSGEEATNETTSEEEPSNEEVAGHTVTVETTFTAETTEGTVETVIPFDASQLGGKTVVVFQQLKVDGYLVGSAEDLYDELETIRIPKIGTTAIDKDTQDHLTNADDDVTIIDEVAYENLVPGESYTLEAVLMDKETGEPVKARVYKEAAEGKEDSDNSEAPEEETAEGEEETPSPSLDEEAAGMDKDTGGTVETKTEEILSEEAEEVTATVTFTPEEASGTVDVTFHFDGSELTGHTFVAFERAYYTDALIASHENIDSEEQTVWTPSVKTVATDKADGDHFVLVPGEQTIVDTVSYTNLIPGKEYSLQMVLMDKETGEPLMIDGKEVTAETAFRPEKADGETTIEVTLNTEGLANKTAVCFEKLFYGEVEIGSHEDITDEDQSIHFIEEAYQTGVTLFGTAVLMLGVALAELAALLLLKSRRK